MEYHSRHYIVTHPADDRKTEKEKCKDKLPINNKTESFLASLHTFTRNILTVYILLPNHLLINSFIVYYKRPQVYYKPEHRYFSNKY